MSRSGAVRGRVFVRHLGSVSFFWSNPALKLQEYLRLNPHTVRDGDPKYASMLIQAMAKLRKRMEPFWARNS